LLSSIVLVPQVGSIQFRTPAEQIDRDKNTLPRPSRNYRIVRVNKSIEKSADIQTVQEKAVLPECPGSKRLINNNE
jgi:hypothetical protein